MNGRESARRFHFLREVASGGFGSVYLCKVVHADGFSRLAAVKLLKAQWTDNEEVVHRMRDEARLLGLLRHRHIVDVMDLTSIDGRTAIVMEYLEAVDFRTVSRELTEPGSRIPVRAALEAMAAVAGALDAAYNRPPIPGEKPLRVIHRDIKPSNIMIDETGMVKVLDFGVARSEIEGRESNTRELQYGSVDYMAPERLFFEPETPASDIYSLGATLYEILALEKLGKAVGSPERHANHIADRLSFLRAQLGLSGAAAVELEALLRSSLSFEHEGRPTAAAFYQRSRALARLMEGEDLSSWSERLLPTLIHAAVSEQSNDDSPLVNTVRTEDSQAFDEEEASPLDPGRAIAVQRGALTELGDQAPTTAFDVPSRDPLSGMDPLDEPDDWEDIPTALAGAPVAPEPTRLSAPTPRVHDPSDPIDETRTTLLDAPDPSGMFYREQVLPTDEVPTRPFMAGQTIIPPDDFSGPPSPTLEPLQTGEMSASPSMAPPRVLNPPPAEQEAPTEMRKITPAPVEPAALPPSEPVAKPAQRTITPMDISPSREAESTMAIVGDVPPQSSRQRTAMVMGLLLGCATPLVVAGGLAASVYWDVGGLRSLVLSSDELIEVALPQPTEPSSPEPSVDASADVNTDATDAASTGAPPAAEPEPVVPDATDAMVFSSEDSRTRTIRVRCDGESARGDAVATLPITAAQTCMVTAILESRERLTVVVENAETGRYRCFVDGAEQCTRD